MGDAAGAPSSAIIHAAFVEACVLCAETKIWGDSVLETITDT